MSTEEVPALPTREQELEYMKFLEESIRTDPWISLRYKKYMASPWRLYYKKKIEQRNEYYKTFLINFLISTTLSWPIIIYLSKKRMVTSAGIPITKVLPSDIFNPQFKMIFTNARNKYTRRAFFYGIFKYSFLAGVIGGYLFTDREFFNNELNARPDLGQFRSMIEVPDKERKVFEAFGDDYFGKKWADKPTSWYKRLKHSIFPSVDYNPVSSHYLPPYDYNRGYFPDKDVSSYYSN